MGKKQKIEWIMVIWGPIISFLLYTGLWKGVLELLGIFLLAIGVYAGCILIGFILIVLFLITETVIKGEPIFERTKKGKIILRNGDEWTEKEGRCTQS